MDAELLSRIAAEVMASMNLAPEHQPTVDRYTRRTLARILDHCHREDVPERLEMLTGEIVEAMLRTDKAVPLPEGNDKEVASIKRGDTSITYRDKGAAVNNVEVFLKDFHERLRRYVKMNLPRGQYERSGYFSNDL